MLLELVLGDGFGGVVGALALDLNFGDLLGFGILPDLVELILGDGVPLVAVAGMHPLVLFQLTFGNLIRSFRSPCSTVHFVSSILLGDYCGAWGTILRDNAFSLCPGVIKSFHDFLLLFLDELWCPSHAFISVVGCLP